MTKSMLFVQVEMICLKAVHWKAFKYMVKLVGQGNPVTKSLGIYVMSHDNNGT
jgi:hypothetical protein